MATSVGGSDLLGFELDQRFDISDQRERRVGPSVLPGAALADEGRLVAGRYRLVSVLGAGGFGRVWKAWDENLRVEVAVKAIELSQVGSAAERAERVARAMREARNAALLRSHPNIVAVHDVVIDAGVPWIVMELVTGRTVKQELDAHGRLAVTHVREIALAVLEALRAAHSAGIVHRDVKPSNVLLADDGRILLADFGTAVQDNDTRMTATGKVIGSVEYLAPERIQHGDNGPAGDLFSLGVTLYQAAEGVSPFRRTDRAVCLAAVLSSQPPPPQYAAELGEFITGLLDKNPRWRPTAETALTILRNRDTAQPPVPPQRPPDHSVVYRAAPTHRRLLLVAGIIYAVAGIISVIALLLAPDGLLSSGVPQGHNIYTLTLWLFGGVMMAWAARSVVTARLVLTRDGVRIRGAQSTFIAWGEIRSILVEDNRFRGRRVRLVLADKSRMSPFPVDTWAARDREFDQKVSTIMQWHARFGIPKPP